MKRLIQQGAFFFAFLVLTAIALEGWLHVRMQDRRAHVLEDWPDMHSLEADLVFLGNSRTAEHLIPTVACEGLNQSCYNLAYDGYSVQMGAYRLDYLLRNGKRKPKFVALQVDLSFCLGDGTQRNFPMKEGVLRYFLLDQIGINRYFRNYGNWREWDAYVPLLRYKGFPLMIFKHLLGWNRWDRRSELGFWHTPKDIRFQLPKAPKNKDVNVPLSGIDSVCKANDIKLIGIIPPSPQSSFRPSDSALDSLARTMEIFDFSDLFAGRETDFFYDGAHFTLDGSEIWSEAVNARLKILEKSAAKDSPHFQQP